MNARAKTGILATAAASAIALAYGADPGAPKELSEVQLPDNSCSIRCPAGTQWRGRSATGVHGVGCTAGFTPVCQCQDDSKPFAACEAVRKPQ